MPTLVRIKSCSPALSSFFRRRFTLTVRVYKAVRCPEPFHQRLPADDLALLLHERLENPVFVFGQIDALAVIGEDGIGGVQNGIPVFQE